MDNGPWYSKQESSPLKLSRNASITSPRRMDNSEFKLIREYNSQVSIPEHQILSFDHLLDDINFGQFQYWIYCIMALMSISEGAQITIFTLMVPILKNEWHISDSLNSLQASFVFVGYLVGSMLSGQLADRVGRRKPFLISSFFTCLLSLGTIACQEIYSLLVVRALLGILVGLFAPCGVTMISEITPGHLRGRYMGLITLTFAIGQLFGLFVAEFTLISLDEGNWRLLTFWCCLPGFLAWFISLFRLRESPRFALLSGQKELAYNIIDEMIRLNGSQIQFNDEMKIKLSNWTHAMNRIAKNQNNASVMSLFENNRFFLTILIWFNWFILSFIYYGIVLLLPDILSHIESTQTGRDKIIQLVISCISDILGAVAAAFFIELKGFGRKNSLIIFFTIQAITAILAFYDVEHHFIYWATASKFFLSMTFIFSFQYTAEVYPTKIRTTGIGMANGIGRLGGVIMPWICMYMNSQQLRSPFILFSILSIITSFSNCMLPFETLGKELE
ncbi:unnamed protein product [Paramecium sonneborni]|uniref:Major facilitator superfamily (MFS) profile domain-containing protein n=1 Tax=Paramecium sonneborni TaxID=65129 RepID=A0A8S1P7J7_9CILI|nr:unnamed protein product [Paramecium sonneborni]